MKKTLMFFAIFTCVLIGCIKQHNDTPTISYYPDGKIKSIHLKQDGHVRYNISLTHNGNIDTIYQLSDSLSKQIEITFNKKGGLNSYFNVKNNIISNHSVVFDSNSHISNIGMPVYVVDGFVNNQMLFFNNYGLLNSNKSHFILIDAEAIKGSKVRLTIQIIGKRFDEIYAVIGDYDENYNLLDKSKVDTIYGKGNVVVADVEIKRGLNLIRGQVVDQGSDKGYPIYFTKDIIAK